MKTLVPLQIFTLLALLLGCKKQQSEAPKPKMFTEQESLIILENSDSTAMRVLQITNTNDSMLLRTPSSEVIVYPNDSLMLHLAMRLQSTLKDSATQGVGIAAAQIGLLKNIICVQRFDKEGKPFEIFINPKILQYTSKKQKCLEGCLSIPNRMDTLSTRAYAILLDYYRIDSTHVLEMIEDFTAVIVQHEVDHLNGILYIDHLKKEMNQVPHVH